MKMCVCTLLVVSCFLQSVAAPAARLVLCSDDDTDIIMCPFPPCSQAVCPGRPDAICLDDSCSDCQARFFVNGQEVFDCEPKPCEAGVEPSVCSPEPCSLATCQKYPSAICVNDNCGGCRAVFYRDGKRLTEADCQACAAPPVNLCPAHQKVNCLGDPCDPAMAVCDNQKGATCFPEYCSGCRDRWFLANCTEVTDTCQGLDS